MFDLHQRRETRGARPAAQRGFTLAEVMVAIAIFAIISAIAMTLYQQLQKNFKQGENAASQQQNTRIAFDRLVADLRMAGFNYNPDGAGGRPDEQIEGMWANAVTVRGDYDFEDTTAAATPESTLGGAGKPFGIISTGNDEIVTYALAKPSGTGGTSIQFQADVTAVPRDGTVDTVTLNNVYLDMNSPPYTLYRITLSAAGAPDKQPVADDIRSLTFTYYDGSGNVLTTMAEGMDTATAIELRKKIAKVGVKIVGMTEDPDLAYFDPADTNPKSRHFRKFELASDVTPRNLGFVGIPDLDLDDPNTPTGLSVCAGHCEGLLATWTANSSSEGVVKYDVSYGTSQLNQANNQDVYATSVYLDNLGTSGSFVVGVAAVDSAGNRSDPYAYSSAASMANKWTPEAPGSPAATSIGAGNAIPNHIAVSWTAPTTNVADPNGVCANDQVAANVAPLRDLKGFRLFRGATATFDPNVPSQVQVPVDPNTLGKNATGYTDGLDPNDPSKVGLVNCRTYFYKAMAEDRCGLKSAQISTSGAAATSLPPKAPQNLIATDMGLQQSLLTWNPVNQDTGATPASILIDTYKVYRAVVSSGGDPNLATYTLLYDGTVTPPGSPSHTDVNIPSIPANESYYYQLTARDDCPNESAPSAPAILTKCNLGGSIQINMSPGGNPVSGTQVITVTVTGGVTPVSGQIIITEATTGTVVLNQTTTTYPYTAAWNTLQSPTVSGRTYDVRAAVTNSSGCTDVQTTTVSVTSPVACCVAASNPRISNNTALGAVGGGTKNNEIFFDIVNGCGADVTIERLNLDWTNLLSNNPQLTAWTYEAQPSVILSPPVNPIGGASPVAKFDLRNAPFTTYSLPTTATVLNPITVSYVFTKAMAGKIGPVPVGNVINTEYVFSVTGQGGTGTCTVTVVADTTTPGITLCDPTIDPNCPGF